MVLLFSLSFTCGLLGCLDSCRCPRTVQELAAIDGTMIVDHNRLLLAVRAIVEVPRESASCSGDSFGYLRMRNHGLCRWC